MLSFYVAVIPSPTLPKRMHQALRYGSGHRTHLCMIKAVAAAIRRLHRFGGRGEIQLAFFSQRLCRLVEAALIKAVRDAMASGTLPDSHPAALEFWTAATAPARKPCSACQMAPCDKVFARFHEDAIATLLACRKNAQQKKKGVIVYKYSV